MYQEMDAKKQVLVNSIIGFLHKEMTSGGLDEEKKESLEVAIQCLETTFELENSDAEKIDLLSLIPVKVKGEVSEQQKAQAEEHKGKGNTAMKNMEYQLALDEYSKAIELNPYNAVYFCNRAAAYTRLMRDNDAINDCNEAIKLDPTYGKAYGRLGIAYSNLNKCDLALEAYRTALKYDPTNNLYETNVKVAEERLKNNSEPSAPPMDPRLFPDNFAQFLNNPNVINMAGQILSDQNFHNMMSGLINNMGGPAGGDGMPAAMETMLQAGQVLAQRVVNEDPDFYNRVARNAQAAAQGTSQDNGDSSTSSAENPPEKKDDGSA